MKEYWPIANFDHWFWTISLSYSGSKTPCKNNNFHNFNFNLFDKYMIITRINKNKFIFLIFNSF